MDNSHKKIAVIIPMSPGCGEKSVDDTMASIKKAEGRCDAQVDIIKAVVDEDSKSFAAVVNRAVASVASYDWFCIVEPGDALSEHWLRDALDYSAYDADAIMPVGVEWADDEKTSCRFTNEIVLSYAFSKTLGFVEHEHLMKGITFSLFGTFMRPSEFLEVGGLKTSLGPVWDYEFLLRATNNDRLSFMVAPKRGYERVHSCPGRLTDMLGGGSDSQWGELALREFRHKEDRGRGVKEKAKEVLN